MTRSNESLKGKVIAIPENRQLVLFSEILRKRGAEVVAVPMVAIHDAPDSALIEKWMQTFIDAPPDLLILLTGEGLRRLISLAEKKGLKTDFINALAKVDKLCRGPKPNQALREIELDRELDALAPTTDGVIASLEKIDLSGKNVAVQLYGEDPNTKLISYLEAAGAKVCTVAPYVYADKLDDEKVIDLIGMMKKNEIDVVAFSSQPQVRRLFQVAKQYKLEAELTKGLSQCHVAAMGPVVKDVLMERGVQVAIMPERTFFMKPLVTAIAKFLNKHD